MLPSNVGVAEPRTNTKTSRFELRLAPHELAFLDGRLRRRDATLSAWVREKLEWAREESARATRRAAAKRIGQMNIDWGISDWSDFEKLLVDGDGEDWD